ncbi:unnamed protein product [Clonostachys rhizophaga]|uniref:Extracellular membrane protein CFEM domain-containing protein n=1 Tax=Clonostachys rhizophaga TaxID=160324 RepID=A0A9N9YJ22_9HYPO|nr:unnamed protein product [Clonostachys rhizophaga]
MSRQHKFPLLVLLLLSLLLNDCRAQAVDKDEVVWTTQSGWNDMKTCAKCKFDSLLCNWPGNLQGDIGCSTNACMCRASTLGQTLKKVSDSVLSACSNYDDQRDATSFLIAYCSDKGYTSIGSAVIASSTAKVTSDSRVSSQTSEAVTTTTKESRTTAPGVISTQIISNGVTSVITITKGPEQTSSSTTSNGSSDITNSSSRDGDKLSKAELIGIIVAVVGVFIAALTLWVTWRGRKRRRAKNKASPTTLPDAGHQLKNIPARNQNEA